jgi:outer membrane protein assembly factor BamD (BamD/ComL family)/tRNA A-37 threonylcarbamoyl transferase component Bud32
MIEGQNTAERQATRRLGHYEMLEQIGQGGMAVVYKGMQRSLNRTVAVKVLPERFARTEELLARFDREANIASQLNHPNIVQVIDRGKEGETLFIVMEFVNGESLDRLIRRGKLSIVQALDYALQICDALEYAHAKGVIHRDLKPSNILVDNESGRAKICDFGIAAIEATGSGLSTLTRENIKLAAELRAMGEPSSLTGENISLGTINYMSPEQRSNAHEVTFHTDIFSFGVVLYEMLTGKLPIGHFKLPSYVNHQVPVRFDDVVMKCLAQSPADRYQSAGAIKADLGRITGRYLRLQRKTSPLPAGWLCGRRRYAIGGVAILAIALTVSLFAHAHRGRTVPGAGGTHRTESADSDAIGDPIAAEYKRALALIGQNKIGEAIPLLKDVQVNGPRPLAAAAQFDICLAYSNSEDYKNALTEYDAFLRSYPESPKAPEALMNKCSITWKTMPTFGTFSTKYYGGAQQQLLKDLQKLIMDHPKSDQVTKALYLIAEVCDKPELNDWKTEADALVALYEREPVSRRDLLYKAAELYAGKANDKALADKAYERFINDFPDDSRRSAADTARKLLNVSKVIAGNRAS